MSNYTNSSDGTIFNKLNSLPNNSLINVINEINVINRLSILLYMCDDGIHTFETLGEVNLNTIVFGDYPTIELRFNSSIIGYFIIYVEDSKLDKVEDVINRYVRINKINNILG